MTTHDNAHKELLVTWLNDAYSMEQALIPVLENHAKDAEEHPEIRHRIEQHVQETRRHAEMVAECVRSLGEEVSGLKSAMGKVMGSFQSVTTGMFGDELIKNALTDYASENFEIAAYRSLLTAAEHNGDQHIAEVCREILRDEEMMAEFLIGHIPGITEDVMHERARAHH